MLIPQASLQTNRPFRSQHWNNEGRACKHTLRLQRVTRWAFILQTPVFKLTVVYHFKSKNVCAKNHANCLMKRITHHAFTGGGKPSSCLASRNSGLFSKSFCFSSIRDWSWAKLKVGCASVKFLCLFRNWIGHTNQHTEHILTVMLTVILIVGKHSGPILIVSLGGLVYTS